MKKEKLATGLLFGFIFLAYTILPSHNNSGDAWGMAADVKFGNDLFSPHHLLYSVTVFLFNQIVATNKVLSFSIFCNAVFAFLSVVVLHKLLGLLTENRLKVFFLTVCTAFSFGFWRFATENEAYIMPIFFSLLGSLYFIKAQKDNRYTSSRIILSGLFATLACLYHQIHIFWFAGLFFGWLFSPVGEEGIFRTGLKRAFIFAATFLIAPLVYFLVIKGYIHQSLTIYNIMHFVFHDYYIGSAGNHVSLANFILGIINFIRTFYQLHGQLFLVISKNPLWMLPGILAAGCILFGVVLVFKKRNTIDDIKKLVHLNLVTHVHLFIFILQLAFAIYNIGNAEFMAMLPVLLAIILAGRRFVPAKAIGYFAASLFTWNMAYGIYPNNSLHFNADDKITEFIIAHPTDKFIVAEPAIGFNQYYYAKGQWPANCWAAPPYYQLHLPLDDLKRRVDSTMEKHGNLFTDYSGRPEILSRGTFLKGQHDFGYFYVFGEHKHTEVARFKTDAGMHVIYKIEPKD